MELPQAALLHRPNRSVESPAPASSHSPTKFQRHQCFGKRVILKDWRVYKNAPIEYIFKNSPAKTVILKRAHPGSRPVAQKSATTVEVVMTSSPCQQFAQQSGKQPGLCTVSPNAAGNRAFLFAICLKVCLPCSCLHSSGTWCYSALPSFLSFKPSQYICYSLCILPLRFHSLCLIRVRQKGKTKAPSFLPPPSAPAPSDLSNPPSAGKKKNNANCFVIRPLIPLTI